MNKHTTRRKSKVNNPALRHIREAALGPNARIVLTGCKEDYDASCGVDVGSKLKHQLNRRVK